ncbi:predicted protein [Naegleria gruberi]|uniref:Predicted protein n=1 Tax=Naegleria gruberi TaxID=5762 RepID=D2VJN5_NAEGR|nr:uncharacterized protein NAEGRDRAFT_69104 [Naegleria gruberi]EFC43062.1 predicted protein [Naegleria gruberi]|eukprot:XP_002675806.1 predicted protein [Naegleria gruberi strain NEG-M]
MGKDKKNTKEVKEQLRRTGTNQDQCETVCSHLVPLLYDKNKQVTLREEILNIKKSSHQAIQEQSGDSMKKWQQSCLDYCKSALSLPMAQCILHAETEKKANQCLDESSKAFKKTLKKMSKSVDK